MPFSEQGRKRKLKAMEDEETAKKVSVNTAAF